MSSFVFYQRYHGRYRRWYHCTNVDIVLFNVVVVVAVSTTRSVVVVFIVVVFVIVIIVVVAARGPTLVFSSFSSLRRLTSRVSTLETGLNLERERDRHWKTSVKKKNGVIKPALKTGVNPDSY